MTDHDFDDEIKALLQDVAKDSEESNSLEPTDEQKQDLANLEKQYDDVNMDDDDYE